MPQNIALHLYFSVSEILDYYSMLAGLTDQESREKKERILSFLNLREKCSQPVMFLSGGQQRRLSLACALMASPPILILDEPTVGTDPVLRFSIWAALREIADQGTTVLLTTHYLEEAAGADCVGFLREGKILQEGKPGELMENFSAKSMERLFLTLCYNEEVGKDETGQDDELTKLTFDDDIMQVEDYVTTSSFAAVKPSVDVTKIAAMFAHQSKAKVSTMDKWKALLFKNLMVLRRHRVFMFFNAILPILNFSIFFFSIGRPLIGLHIAFNLENSVLPISCPTDNLYNCNQPSHSLSLLCHIKHQLEEQDISLDQFKDVESAVTAVRTGDAAAALSFPENLTFDWIGLNTEGGEQPRVGLFQDWSNRQVGDTVKMAVTSSVISYLENTLQNCGAAPGSGQWLNFSAILGSLELSSHLTMLPAMVVITLHFLALALTADLLVTEKEQGLLQRDWTAGVPTTLALAAQICVQSIIVFIQVTSSVALLVFLYLPPATVVILATFIILLQCWCGMIWGAVISLACRTREQVIQLALAIIFPMFLMAGVLWPRTTMPVVLQYLAECLPLTPACDAVRDLLLRGHLGGWVFARAVMVPGAWIVGLLLLSKYYILKKLHRD